MLSLVTIQIPKEPTFHLKNDMNEIFSLFRCALLFSLMLPYWPANADVEVCAKDVNGDMVCQYIGNAIDCMGEIKRYNESHQILFDLMKEIDSLYNTIDKSNNKLFKRHPEFEHYLMGELLEKLPKECPDCSYIPPFLSTRSWSPASLNQGNETTPAMASLMCDCFNKFKVMPGYVCKSQGKHWNFE